jgi:hypothetical protein
MPQGKPAGVRCAHLLPDARCDLFGQPERPAVCTSLQPSVEMCGTRADEALHWLLDLEVATRPVRSIREGRP